MNLVTNASDYGLSAVRYRAISKIECANVLIFTLVNNAHYMRAAYSTPRYYQQFNTNIECFYSQIGCR